MTRPERALSVIRPCLPLHSELPASHWMWVPRKYSSDQSSCSSLKPELCYLTERVNEGTCGHLS